MRSALFGLWSLGLLACGTEIDGQVGVQALLRPEAMVPFDQDPMADHRAEGAECPEGSWGPENGGLEVQTGYCEYLSIAQPLGTDVRAGDTMELLVWHDRLSSAEPAHGHFALHLAGKTILEGTVEIPSEAAAYASTFVFIEDVEAETPLGFHVHNHGFNSWTWARADLRTSPH